MKKWLLLAAGILAIVAIGWLELPATSQALATAALQRKLDGLVGKTGLDPLDPVQPLTDVRILQIGRAPTGGDEARIRFTYADGSSRVYETWLANRDLPFGGWRYTGLDRVFAPHQALPGLPVVDASSPLDLGPPVRIDAVDAVNSPSVDLARWFDDALLTPRSIWSPGGDALLLGLPPRNTVEMSLWLVPLDGGEPRRLADGVIAAQWMPDSQGIALLKWPERPETRIARLALMNRQGAVRWSLDVPLDPVPPFATTDRGVLFVKDNALWLMPAASSPDGQPERLRDLPDVRHQLEQSQPAPPIAPAPTGDRLAYVCGVDVCLADLRGGAPRRIALAPLDPAIPLDGSTTPVATPTPIRPPSNTAPIPSGGLGLKPTPLPLGPSSLMRIRLAWSPDGQRLAVARSSTEAFWCNPRLCYRYQPRLTIVDPSGQALLDVGIGPDGFVDTPQWMPNGDFLFLPDYPENGRRIVAVDVSSGRIYDLSRPRWDAFFALSPDGTRLLVTNARGGFWLAPVVERSAEQTAASRATGPPMDVPIPTTPGPPTPAPRPTVSLWIAPDSPDLDALRAAAQEYLYLRKQAFITGDLNRLWARYPALRQGADPSTGVNDEASKMASFHQLGLIDGDVAPESYERIGIRMRDDDAEITIHGFETYLRKDFSQSGSELWIRLFLRRDGRRWTIVKTDEVTDAEYHENGHLYVTPTPTPAASVGERLAQKDAAVWDRVIAGTGQSISPLLKPWSLPVGFADARLVQAEPGTFTVEYTGPGLRLSIGVGAFNPPPPEPDGYQRHIEVDGWPATLQVQSTSTPSQRVMIWWSEQNGIWRPPGATGATLGPFYLVVAEGLDPDAVEQIVSSLGRVVLS